MWRGTHREFLHCRPNMEYIKDPDAILDYTINWSSWLPAGDAIAESTWTAGNGITIDSDSNTSTSATVWLSGGTVGATYTVTNHIVTDDGREEDQTISIIIREK